MSMVLDSSITVALVYSEETTPAVESVLELLTHGGAWVPSLWKLEVANIMEMSVRRGRHDFAFSQATLADLSALPINLDPETDQRTWDSILQLAHLHRLTVYEAAYLELAKRRGLPLATLDRELRAAAGTENISLLGM